MEEGLPADKRNAASQGIARTQKSRESSSVFSFADSSRQILWSAMSWMSCLRLQSRESPQREESERFKSFAYEDLLKRAQSEPGHLWAEGREPRRLGQTNLQDRCLAYR